MKKTFLIIIPVIVMYASCKDMGSNPPSIPPPPPLPEDIALYVSMDGDKGGLWILNANSLELADSIITRPGVPWTIEFSPDYRSWYSCWGTRQDYALYCGNVYPLSIESSVRLSHSKPALVKSGDQRYLVTYGAKGIEVFDRATLSLIHQDSSTIFGDFPRVVASRNSNLIYFTRWRQLDVFGIYNLDSLRITDTLRLFDEVQYPGLEDADLAISPDDRFLFLSAWNWRGGGGFNSFFVIDIPGKRLVTEYPCGQFARLAGSPDGRHLYISKAGFTLYLFPPDNHRMYRYDVQTNTMHDFLNRGGSTGIVVADDNRTVFISDFSEIKKVDAFTGITLCTYAVPLDSLGRLASHIRNIRLGKYPANHR